MIFKPVYFKRRSILEDVKNINLFNKDLILYITFVK